MPKLGEFFIPAHSRQINVMFVCKRVQQVRNEQTDPQLPHQFEARAQGLWEEKAERLSQRWWRHSASEVQQDSRLQVQNRQAPHTVGRGGGHRAPPLAETISHVQEECFAFIFLF